MKRIRRSSRRHSTAPTGLQPSAEGLRVATRGTALRPTSLTSPLRQASGKPCFLLFSLIFTGVRLLYDVVLVSTAQKNESFCKATLFWTSFPFRPPQCMKQFPVLCSKFPLVIYFLHRTNSVCVKPNPPTPPTPSPLGIHTLVPFVCVSISEKSPVLKTWGSGE